MFGKRLAEERERLGLSQKALADIWGIGRSAVGMIETGKSMVDVERLSALRSFDFDVLYLLVGERSKVAAATLLDWELATRILEAIRKWSCKRSLKLPIEKEMLILKLLYERFARDGLVDEKKIEEALRIAA